MGPRLDAATRAAIMSALGHAAKALGPATFLQLVPLRVATNEGSPDTSYLLTVLHGHIGHASLAHFASYMIPLQEWLRNRADELRGDQREIEAANLRQLYAQVWALFPGYCSCATDAATAFGGMARTLGATITGHPEVRLPVLQGLTLLILSQQSHKQPLVEAGKVTMQLTAEAKASLASVGSYAKNFMPLLFNTHQAEPTEKQQPLQDAIAAMASIAPPELLSDFFKAVMRKLLEAATHDAGKAKGGGGGGDDDAMEDEGEAKAAATQRGLLELLIGMVPSLQAPHRARYLVATPHFRRLHLGCTSPSLKHPRVVRAPRAAPPSPRALAAGGARGDALARRQAAAVAPRPLAAKEGVQGRRAPRRGAPQLGA